MEKDYFWTWIVLLFASAGVFHHAGIKIPYFAFFGHDSGKRCQEAPAHMLVAMAIATLPTPAEEDFCAKGAKFGPHNLHENRPGSMQTEDIIFATYHNAGLRIYDSRDAFQPKQIGYFVPPAPEKIVDQRPNPAQVIQSCDVFVDKEGLMYLTDTNAGLYILQFEGH